MPKITVKLDASLTLQRIWQDLVEEYGCGASYESVKRANRPLAGWVSGHSMSSFPTPW